MDEDYMILPKSTKQYQQQIQLKLSTIFNQKVIDTPQTFGSFYDANGEKYCAISALSDKIQNGKNANPAELIPYAILEKIENFTAYGNPKKKLNVFVQDPIITIVIV
jgi:hypothetical protein